MIRTVVAALVFMALYGVALRVYAYLRLKRDAQRWHWPAIAVAAAIGGLGFYLSQQIRAPYVPRWLDIPALFIMAFGAAAIPLILDASQVIRARMLMKFKLEGKEPCERGR